MKPAIALSLAGCILAIGGVALATGLVLVVVRAEAHNRRAPHLCRPPRDPGHQLQQAEAVLPAYGMPDGGQKLLDGRTGCHGLVLGLVHSHVGSLADGGRLVSGNGAGKSRCGDLEFCTCAPSAAHGTAKGASLALPFRLWFPFRPHGAGP